MLNITCDGGIINLIQFYALTSDKSDEEIKNFFENIDTFITTTKKHITMILWDFNGKSEKLGDGCTGAF